MIKILAYFLPQFHHTPENDLFWGEGFTDWDNLKTSKKYFRNHRMPLVPSKLGYYDLSDIKSIQRVCKYSLEKGIDGFGYWHYWFGDGKQTLEKVPEMHLSDLSNKQNFFFAWANTSWTKSWQGDDSTIIFNQEYSKKSAINHFAYLRKFLSDNRYVRYKSKPIFQVLNPDDEGLFEHISIIEDLAITEFGQGLYWLFPCAVDKSIFMDFDYSIVGYPPGSYTKEDFFLKLKKKLIDSGILNGPLVISEKKYLSLFEDKLKEQLLDQNFFPCLLSGWDNTPRYKERGFLIDAKISTLLNKQFDILFDSFTFSKEQDIIFIKAWNEWAEGNVIEPYTVEGVTDDPSSLIIDFKNKFSK